MTDDDSKIELNRRRVLGGIVTVGAAAAAAGAGTTAYFSDTQASSNNTIEAGEVTLNGVSGTQVTLGPLYPSQDTADGQSASIGGDYASGVDATLDWGINVVNDPDGVAPLVLLDNVQLTVGGTDVNDYSGSYGDLDALNTEGTFPNAATLTNGDTISITFDVRLDSNAGNQYENATLEFDVGFKARQLDSGGSRTGTPLAQGDI